jgi:type IV secretion system protein VirB10
MSKENNAPQPEDNQSDLPEVEQELSKVASNPKQSMLILIGLGLIFAYLFFSFFISSGDPAPSETPIPTDVVKPAQVSSDSAVPSIPGLPSPPKLEDPTPPPPPPPSRDTATALPPLPEGEPALPSDSSQDLLPPTNDPTLPFNGASTKGEEERKRLEAKRKSSIVLIAGKPPAKTPEQLEQEADFKYRGDMNLVLGRGKMLDALIETAINSDFGGEIRAIISRDVYSEWGHNVLIPKGSRVFGTYNTGINGAYGRIAIEWNRIDLASGYTLNLSGSGMDNLGRKGAQGRVDNKFKERFSNAILQSAFNITVASTLDTIVKPVTNSQTAASQTAEATAAANAANTIFAQPNSATVTDQTKFAQICLTVPTSIADKTSALYTAINAACTAPQGSATPTQQLTALMSAITAATTASAASIATATQESQAQKASKQAFTDISDLAKEILKAQKFEPTITLDQGTPIKIYVNKDYKFPKAAMKKVMK